MLPLSVEQVIQMAINEAEQLQQRGKLISMKEPHDWNNDDEAQTINSIYNLYREFVMPQDEGLLYNELYLKYSQYF